MLKKIEEYTNSEVLALSEDQVENIIKLHLADAGVKFPIKPTEPTYFDIPEADVTSWTVTGVDLYFSKKEVAEEVAKVLKNNMSVVFKRHWGSDYDHQTLKAASSEYNFDKGVQVEEVKTYSQELLNQISTKIAQNKTMKEQYEKDVKAYEEAFSAAQDIMETVRNTVESAHTAQREKDRLLEHFKEYLRLADNNSDMAWKFMKKAYEVSQEQEDYINANV